jgi:hypothetical protein
MRSVPNLKISISKNYFPTPRIPNRVSQKSAARQSAQKRSASGDRERPLRRGRSALSPEEYAMRSITALASTAINVAECLTMSHPRRCATCDMRPVISHPFPKMPQNAPKCPIPRDILSPFAHPQPPHTKNDPFEPNPFPLTPLAPWPTRRAVQKIPAPLEFRLGSFHPPQPASPKH